MAPHHVQQPRGHRRTWRGMPVLRETCKLLEELVQNLDGKRVRLWFYRTCLTGEMQKVPHSESPAAYY